MPDFGDEMGEKALDVMFRGASKIFDWWLREASKSLDAHRARKNVKKQQPKHVQNAEKMTSALESGLRSTPADSNGIVSFTVPLSKLKLQGLSHETELDLVKTAVEKQFAALGVHGDVRVDGQRTKIAVSVLEADRDKAVSAVKAAIGAIAAQEQARKAKIKSATCVDGIAEKLKGEVEKAPGDAEGRFAASIALDDRSLGDDPMRIASAARAYLEEELKGAGVEDFGLSIDEGDSPALVISGKVADKEAITGAIGRVRDAMVHDAIVSAPSQDPALELAEIDAYLADKSVEVEALDSKVNALSEVRARAASAPAEAGVARTFVDVGGMDPQATADAASRAVGDNLKASGHDGDAVMQFDPKSGRLSISFNEVDRAPVLEALGLAREQAVAANGELTSELGMLRERSEALKSRPLVADTQRSAAWLKDLGFKVNDTRLENIDPEPDRRFSEVACPYEEIGQSVEFSVFAGRLEKAGVEFEASPAENGRTRISVAREDAARAKALAEEDNAALAAAGYQPFSTGLDGLDDPPGASSIASVSMPVPGAAAPQRAAWAASVKAVLAEELEREQISERAVVSYDEEAGELAVEYPRELAPRVEAAASRAEDRMDARRGADETQPFKPVDPEEETRHWYDDREADTTEAYAASRVVADVSAFEFTEREMAQAVDSLRDWLGESPIRGSFSLVAQGDGAIAFNPLTRDAESLQNALDSIVMHDFRDPCTQYAAGKLYEAASPNRADFTFDVSCGRERMAPLAVSMPADYMSSASRSAEDMLQVIKDSGARLASAEVSPNGMRVAFKTPKDLEQGLDALSRARESREQATRKANIARRKGHAAPSRGMTDLERTKQLMLEASSRLKAGDIPMPSNFPSRSKRGPSLPSQIAR